MAQSTRLDEDCMWLRTFRRGRCKAMTIKKRTVKSTRIAERCATAAADMSFARNVSASTMTNYYSTGTSIFSMSIRAHGAYGAHVRTSSEESFVFSCDL